MDFIRVCNWDELQHYKDREPKWIKVYREILNDYKMEKLSDATFGQLVKIWLLASQLGNEIPYDKKWIQKKIGASSKIDFSKLISLEYIECYSRGEEPVSNCTEPYIDKIREEKNKIRVDKSDVHNLSKPTLEEVKAYFIQEKIDIAPDYFWGFYEKKGWMVGKSKMTNWHIAAGQARSWDNAPKNPDLRGKADRLCDCGCGRGTNIIVSNNHFYNSECRKKFEGW